MPIETALAELETIARRLEDPAVPLEESLSLYERGKALAAHCQQVLREATLRVEVLRTVEEHTTTLEMFATDEDE
jgi:exodeoxyribonuclease VII small subunit